MVGTLLGRLQYKNIQMTANQKDFPQLPVAVFLKNKLAMALNKVPQNI